MSAAARHGVDPRLAAKKAGLLEPEALERMVREALLARRVPSIETSADGIDQIRWMMHPSKLAALAAVARQAPPLVT
jgi:hypothetical protein